MGLSVVHLQLRLHPECRCGAVASIDAAVALTDAGELSLDYRVYGAIEALALPTPTASERKDGLWKHSCFELFLGLGSSAYCEFNFSPSGQWAAYRFEDYRAGMSNLPLPTPAITGKVVGDAYEFSAGLRPEFQGSGRWPIGLSAVIEETSGRLSYWALAHPPGKPDFHHRDCFAAELAAPSWS